ncbi:MAG: peptidoglycan-binding protein [Selenomonadales bacterium]|nr:peptidoglycan-binding protein [Selenomonadales bacterium]
MEYERPLKLGMEGEDVRYMKDSLVRLGYLFRSTHDKFGNDTAAAVKRFQEDKGLYGVITADTWAAIEAAVEKQGEPAEIPANISESKAALISTSLLSASDVRKKIVLEALRHAYDPAKPTKYPPSLYIRGGNLYNKDFTINTITAAEIESGAKRQPQYYTAKAKQIMLEAVAANPATTGADCSGGIVGLMRFARLVGGGFDTTANSLCGNAYSTAVDKASLQAGDWVGRSGHIGLYVGGGYVVEWAGHKLGCQLTDLDNRKCFDFTTGKMSSAGSWSKFRRPKAY